MWRRIWRDGSGRRCSALISQQRCNPLLRCGEPVERLPAIGVGLVKPAAQINNNILQHRCPRPFRIEQSSWHDRFSTVTVCVISRAGRASLERPV